jgi:hypothetical protein
MIQCREHRDRRGIQKYKMRNKQEAAMEVVALTSFLVFLCVLCDLCGE